MDEEFEKWFRTNSVTICKSTTHISDFVFLLRGKGLVNETMQAKVQGIAGSTMQCSELYYHLVKLGFNRIHEIVVCLKESDNLNVAKKFSDFKALWEEKFGVSSTQAPVVLDFFVDINPLTVKVIPAKYLMGDEHNRYKMTSKPRGLALIINNREFTDPSHNRVGSEQDFTIMQELFRQLHFEVMAHENVTSTGIDQILTEFKARFKTQAVDSCVVCIMSHGTASTVLMADCVEINYWTQLIYEFDCRRFAHFETKPKLFIIQACAQFKSGTGPGSLNPAGQPEMRNALVCCSTLPGTPAKRDTIKGTWYINCLAQVVMNEAHRTEARVLFGDMIQKGMRSVKSSSQRSDLQMSYCIPFDFDKKFYFNPGVMYP